MAIAVQSPGSTDPSKEAFRRHPLVHTILDSEDLGLEEADVDEPRYSSYQSSLGATLCAHITNSSSASLAAHAHALLLSPASHHPYLPAEFHNQHHSKPNSRRKTARHSRSLYLSSLIDLIPNQYRYLIRRIHPDGIQHDGISLHGQDAEPSVVNLMGSHIRPFAASYTGHTASLSHKCTTSSLLHSCTPFDAPMSLCFDAWEETRKLRSQT
ncbi:hypothetical protein BDP27DRAFT_1428817 [Rhodocollybia butyracea]|uniref:Uncharacterized protein n=1 Tax=Rhodocollybia butyracea TaxID=206335 RepID=A0A9P5U1F3_9AGAR|nr:hypothetical protein BDP27DRAFT_1428817 [Rhodocollybia butyracea]